MKKIIRDIIDKTPPAPKTKEELDKLPPDGSYFTSNMMFRAREGERPFLDFKGSSDGFCKVRINGYTLIANEDFVDLQYYIRDIELKLKGYQNEIEID